MVLREPERFDGYLVMGMMHLWQTRRTVLPNLWRLYYQVPIATIGGSLLRRTGFIKFLFRFASDVDPADARVFAERFRDPVCARTGRNTYRTFPVHDVLVAARRPGYRPTTVPIRALLGTRDPAIPVSMTASETARADDYTLETVDAGHFVVDERPDLVRKKLIDLAEETAH